MKNGIFSGVRRIAIRLGSLIDKWGSVKVRFEKSKPAKKLRLIPRKGVIEKLRDIPRQLISGPRSIKQLFLLSGRYGRALVKYIGFFSVLLWLFLIYIGKPLLVAAIAYGYAIAVIYTATLVNPLADTAKFDYELATQFIGWGALVRLSLVIFGFGAVAKFVSAAAFLTAAAAFFAFMALVFTLLVAHYAKQIRESKDCRGS